MEVFFMVRFVHFSDSHLGRRQYNLGVREEDVYCVFDQVIDWVIGNDVDFVVHSGDLFEHSNPSPRSLVAFQRGLVRLSGAGIPLFGIAGNHDILLREGSVPPLDVFEENGLCVIDDDQPFYVVDDVFVGGLSYHPRSRVEEFCEKLDDLSRAAEGYSKRVLLLHQGVAGDIDTWEVKGDVLPVNFDYYGMGHLHKFKQRGFGRGELVYSGSCEVSREDEDRDKSFCLVEISDDGEVSVERVMIELPREYIKRSIRYECLEEELEHLKSEVVLLENRPVLDLTVVGDFDYGEVYSLLHSVLDECSVKIIHDFRALDVFDKGDLVDDGSLNLRDLLFRRACEDYDEEISGLIVKLYDGLSKSEMEASEDVLDALYQEYDIDNGDD